MLKVRIFHGNAVEKLPRITEQMNEFMSEFDKEDIVSVNTTEIGSPDKDAGYSYTVLVLYKPKSQ